MSWKDFFYFSRRERQGIVLLLIFIAGIFAGKRLFSPAKPQALDGQEATEQATSQPLADPDSVKPPVYTPDTYKRNKPRYNQPQQKQERTYYVQKEEAVMPPNNIRSLPAEKFSEGTVIDLNEADTTALMHIPGIGKSFAKRISAYRKLLGGYHRIEQLQEVYGMYEELYAQITPYLKIDPPALVRIPVNSASLDKLKAHPYLNFYQAKAIVELRNKKGHLSGINDLQLLEEFSDEDWIRISPYLEF
jgi:DNA uptake protein ComE-like DNA-binding protein